MNDRDGVPDLRPSPWPVHGVIVTMVLLAYAVVAVSAWPRAAPPAHGKVEQGLSVLVAVGQGAAAGAIMMLGVVVLIYVALTTCVLGLQSRRTRNPWLVHAVFLSTIALIIAVASLVGCAARRPPSVSKPR